jgi:hypothetical protein
VDRTQAGTHTRIVEFLVWSEPAVADSFPPRLLEQVRSQAVQTPVLAIDRRPRQALVCLFNSTQTSIAALRAQSSRAAAAPSSSERPGRELSFTESGGVQMETRAVRAKRYRKEAQKYSDLASSGPQGLMNDVHRRLAERYARMADDLERREDLTNSLTTFLTRRE